MATRVLLPLLLLWALQTFSAAQDFKREQPFDSDWKFHRGKLPGAESAGYADEDWRSITLPHDWSIEDLPKPDEQEASTDGRIVSGPFSSKALCGNATGYTVGGTGWYRKHFRLPREYEGGVVAIYFDGVYMNADVWINGHHLGNHPYGYTAFGYDLSPFLHFGEADNVIAVEVKNEGCNSRWYSGSGIYRHVSLDIANKIHAAHWGAYVTTRHADSLRTQVSAKVTVSNSLRENADVSLRFAVLDPHRHKVAEKVLNTQLFSNTPSDISFTVDIAKPEKWSPDSPSLYELICEIERDGHTLDKTGSRFGIRTLEFDSEKGFLLNGSHLKLKGGAMHANNGPLGAAAYDRAEERRVELMKAAGFNAVRCGHNPPSSAFLDACDRLGMLVMDEAFDVWMKGWFEDDYHVYFNDWWRRDIQSMIMRDRNHPSIFVWGIGNQVRENRDSIGIALAYELAGYIRSIDNSRPVTANVAQTGRNWRNCLPDEWRKCDPFFAALDICGYSYQSSQYENDHTRLPNRIMFSSEIDPRHSFDNWMRAMDCDYVLGNFEWTAMDFMGEVSLGWWGFKMKDPNQLYPWTSTYSGDIDLCGFRRPRSYYRDVLFDTGTKLSTFVFAPVPSFEGPGDSPWGWDDVKPSWTWPGYEGKSLSVVAYSRCDSVQLVLNDTILGTKGTSRETEFKATWQVPYRAGVLKSIGYVNGKKTAEWQLVTSGEPARIRLTADRTTIKADGQDLCFVTVEVNDKHGVMNPQAQNLISFSVAGEGNIVAVGNSNPLSMESFQQPYRKAYEGKCIVIIQSKRKSGKVTLTAASKGLVSDKIAIVAE